MHRQPLRLLLQQHAPFDPTEAQMLTRTFAFVDAHPDCFDRSLMVGHITGSAWIMNPARTQTVLIHHRKLARWLQPGGHADGDPDVAGVALREAQEETGLTSLRLLSPTLFDVDIHPIPARANLPEHLDYDIRFLLEANPSEPFIHSDETNAIQWIDLVDIAAYTNEESVLRLVRKVAGEPY